jgi:hypothetical protein
MNHDFVDGDSPGGSDDQHPSDQIINAQRSESASLNPREDRDARFTDERQLP